MNDPHIIRQDKPHEVVVGDGSQVAASKSNDPQGPQVRKVLAGDDEPVEDSPQFVVPPPIARRPDEPGGPVFERQATSAEHLLAVPDAIARAADDGLVFDRSIQDGEPAQSPPEPLRPAAADDAPVIDRSLQDHRVAVPEALPTAADEPAPVFERASHSHREAAPEGSAAAAAAQTLPPEGGRAEAPVPVSAAETTPAEPALPPVAAEQAQAQILETAKEIHEKVEETLGAADPTWVQMDFPARVIRLKIENDKVRTKLERLEAMTLKI